MRFNNWWVLLLLILIPLLHRWWSRRNRPAKVTFPLTIPARVAKSNHMRWLLLLRYTALAFLVVALARPQTSFKQVDRTVNGVDIMLVLDVSASMNIEDLAEKSRLDVAKETMEKFIRGRENDRMGFVVFSGEPLTLAPPTLDYGLLLKSVGEATTGVLKDGTGIGDGLALGVSRLRNSKAKSKIIILLTDGDNNVGQVDPATAGELAAGFGIRVYTIAVGREGRVKMPIRQKGLFGNTITTYQWFDNALNPELLQHISKITGAKFYRVTDAGALEDVFSEIDHLEKTEVRSKEKIKFNDAFKTPLQIGFLLLLLEQILAFGFWRIAI
ncbi:VWA domain-containing protein [bacterium]|jgi:Ca-activated chloride channel family protein|nr:VWA domain-containing protein [bacterium]